MKITTVLSSSKFLAIFIFLSLIFTISYFIITGIYVLSLREFNEAAQPLRIVLTVIIATLTGLAVTLIFYRSERPLVCNENLPAFAGSVVGMFATACPVCFPLLLTVFGVGGATALAVSQNAVPIQFTSAALLAASIWFITMEN